MFDGKLRALLALILLIVAAMSAFGPRESLDAKLYYSGAEARALFARQEPAEARRYFGNELGDLVLIAVYTAALVIALRRARGPGAAVLSLALAPGLFDLVETSLVLRALSQPESDWFLDGLGAVTLLKWICAVFALAALAPSLLRRAFGRDDGF